MSRTNLSLPTPPERKAQALQRLDASRTQLIIQLLPSEDAGRAPASGTANLGPDTHAFGDRLLKRIQRNGLVKGSWRMARAWGRRWWLRQPWHAPVELLASTLVHEAKPIVRRHPWAALTLGAALGAGVVALMPAASRAVRHRAAPWRHQVSSMVWTQLAQAPVQIALASALTAWLNQLAPSTAKESPSPSGDDHPAAAAPIEATATPSVP